MIRYDVNVYKRLQHTPPVRIFCGGYFFFYFSLNRLLTCFKKHWKAEKKKTGKKYIRMGADLDKLENPKNVNINTLAVKRVTNISNVLINRMKI